MSKEESTKLVELISELESLIETFDEEKDAIPESMRSQLKMQTSSSSQIEKVLLKLRRFSISKELLLKTNTGVRLNTIIKTFRKKHKKHMESVGNDESDKIVSINSLLKQVKSTWKAQVIEDCEKTNSVKQEVEEEIPEEKKVSSSLNSSSSGKKRKITTKKKGGRLKKKIRIDSDDEDEFRIDSDDEESDSDDEDEYQEEEEEEEEEEAEEGVTTSESSE